MAHVTIPCPHLIPGVDEAEGEQVECGADVEVELTYEPPDSSYGADADGRRGVYVNGYWFVDGSIPDTCARKCVWTEEDAKEVDRRAEEEAEDYEEEVDYPDEREGEDAEREYDEHNDNWQRYG